MSVFFPPPTPDLVPCCGFQLPGPPARLSLTAGWLHLHPSSPLPAPATRPESRSRPQSPAPSPSPHSHPSPTPCLGPPPYAQQLQASGAEREEPSFPSNSRACTVQTLGISTIRGPIIWTELGWTSVYPPLPPGDQALLPRVVRTHTLHSPRASPTTTIMTQGI